MFSTVLENVAEYNTSSGWHYFYFADTTKSTLFIKGVRELIKGTELEVNNRDLYDDNKFRVRAVNRNFYKGIHSHYVSLSINQYKDVLALYPSLETLTFPITKPAPSVSSTTITPPTQPQKSPIEKLGDIETCFKTNDEKKFQRCINDLSSTEKTEFSPKIISWIIQYPHISLLNIFLEDSILINYSKNLLDNESISEDFLLTIIKKVGISGLYDSDIKNFCRRNLTNILHYLIIDKELDSKYPSSTTGELLQYIFLHFPKKDFLTFLPGFKPLSKTWRWQNNSSETPVTTAFIKQDAEVVKEILNWIDKTSLSLICDNEKYNLLRLAIIHQTLDIVLLLIEKIDCHALAVMLTPNDVLSAMVIYLLHERAFRDAKLVEKIFSSSPHMKKKLIDRCLEAWCEGVDLPDHLKMHVPTEEKESKELKTESKDSEYEFIPRIKPALSFEELKKIDSSEQVKALWEQGIVSLKDYRSILLSDLSNEIKQVARDLFRVGQHFQGVQGVAFKLDEDCKSIPLIDTLLKDRKLVLKSIDQKKIPKVEKSPLDLPDAFDSRLMDPKLAFSKEAFVYAEIKEESKDPSPSLLPRAIVITNDTKETRQHAISTQKSFKDAGVSLPIVFRDSISCRLRVYSRWEQDESLIIYLKEIQIENLKNKLIKELKDFQTELESLETCKTCDRRHNVKSETLSQIEKAVSESRQLVTLSQINKAWRNFSILKDQYKAITDIIKPHKDLGLVLDKKAFNNLSKKNREIFLEYIGKKIITSNDASMLDPLIRAGVDIQEIVYILCNHFLCLSDECCADITKKTEARYLSDSWYPILVNNFNEKVIVHLVVDRKFKILNNLSDYLLHRIFFHFSTEACLALIKHLDDSQLAPVWTLRAVSPDENIFWNSPNAVHCAFLCQEPEVVLALLNKIPTSHLTVCSRERIKYWGQSPSPLVSLLNLAILYQTAPVAALLLDKIYPHDLQYLLELDNHHALSVIAIYVLYEPAFFENPTLLKKLFSSTPEITKKLTNFCLEAWREGAEFHPNLKIHVKTDEEEKKEHELENRYKLIPRSNPALSFTDLKKLPEREQAVSLWKQGLVSFEDYRQLQASPLPYATRQAARILRLADMLLLGAESIPYEPDPQYEMISRIEELSRSQRLLLKIVKKDNLPEFIRQIQDPSFRAELRKQTFDKTTATHKFHHLRGEVIPYTYHRPADKKKAPYTHSIKQPVSLDTPGYRMQPFGSHRSGEDLVGIFSEVKEGKHQDPSASILKAMLKKDFGTYNRGWVGNKATARGYAKIARLYNSTDFKEFQDWTRRNPYRLNEPLAKVPKGSLCGIVIATDTPTARSRALLDQKAYQDQKIALPVVIRNPLFPNGVRLYSKWEQDEKHIISLRENYIRIPKEKLIKELNEFDAELSKSVECKCCPNILKSNIKNDLSTLIVLTRLIGNNTFIELLSKLILGWENFLELKSKYKRSLEIMTDVLREESPKPGLGNKSTFVCDAKKVNSLSTEHQEFFSSIVTKKIVERNDTVILDAVLSSGPINDNILKNIANTLLKHIYCISEECAIDFFKKISATHLPSDLTPYLLPLNLEREKLLVDLTVRFGTPLFLDSRFFSNFHLFSSENCLAFLEKFDDVLFSTQSTHNYTFLHNAFIYHSEKVVLKLLTKLSSATLDFCSKKTTYLLNATGTLLQWGILYQTPQVVAFLLNKIDSSSLLFMLSHQNYDSLRTVAIYLMYEDSFFNDELVRKVFACSQEIKEKLIALCEEAWCHGADLPLTLKKYISVKEEESKEVKLEQKDDFQFIRHQSPLSFDELKNLNPTDQAKAVWNQGVRTVNDYRSIQRSSLSDEVKKVARDLYTADLHLLGAHSVDYKPDDELKNISSIDSLLREGRLVLKIVEQKNFSEFLKQTENPTIDQIASLETPGYKLRLGIPHQSLVGFYAEAEKEESKQSSFALIKRMSSKLLSLFQQEWKVSNVKNDLHTDFKTFQGEVATNPYRLNGVSVKLPKDSLRAIVIINDTPEARREALQYQDDFKRKGVILPIVFRNSLNCQIQLYAQWEQKKDRGLISLQKTYENNIQTQITTELTQYYDELHFLRKEDLLNKSAIDEAALTVLYWRNSIPDLWLSRLSQIRKKFLEFKKEHSIEKFRLENKKLMVIKKLSRYKIDLEKLSTDIPLEEMQKLCRALATFQDRIQNETEESKLPSQVAEGSLLPEIEQAIQLQNDKVFQFQKKKLKLLETLRPNLEFLAIKQLYSEISKKRQRETEILNSLEETAVHLNGILKRFKELSETCKPTTMSARFWGQGEAIEKTKIILVRFKNYPPGSVTADMLKKADDSIKALLTKDPTQTELKNRFYP